MKCNANGCQSEATYDVFWPGQESKQCDLHTEHTRKVARAMGFDLSVQKIATYDFPEHWKA